VSMPPESDPPIGGEVTMQPPKRMLIAGAPYLQQGLNGPVDALDEMHSAHQFLWWYDRLSVTLSGAGSPPLEHPLQIGVHCQCY
jgi:hypothetical protein